MFVYTVSLNHSSILTFIKYCMELSNIILKCTAKNTNYNKCKYQKVPLSWTQHTTQYNHQVHKKQKWKSIQTKSSAKKPELAAKTI